MHRRQFLFITSASALGLPAAAHHGWSSFDQTRPLYLEGLARKVSWKNPHAELELELLADLKLPADLVSRALPAQTAPVDAAALLKAAQLPTRRDRRWQIELAPLPRLAAWKVPPIQDGDRIALLGFTFTGEKGDPVLRAEYVFLGNSAYALRSGPA